MSVAASRAARWQSLWSDPGLACLDTDLMHGLMQRYAEPHRSHHTMQHLDECFANFDAIHHEAKHPAEFELALWFHDAIYDFKGHDNEQQSADWVHLDVLSVGGSSGLRKFARPKTQSRQQSP